MRKAGLFLVLVLSVFLIVKIANGQTMAKKGRVFDSSYLKYEGVLTDQSGSDLQGGYVMTFRVYDSPTSLTALWEETHRVTVMDGAFAVILGRKSPLPSTDEGSSYIGILIEGNELSPRQEIKMGSIGDLVGDIRFPELYMGGPGIVGPPVVTPYLGGGESGWTDDGAAVRLTTVSDSVGIGTATPTEKLEVVGTVRMTGIEIPTGATAGYVLTSDASGTGSWQEAPGGGGGSGGWVDDGAVVRLETDSDQVGIGTVSPQNKLDVEGGVAIGANYSGTETAPSEGLIVEGNAGIGTQNPTSAKLVVDGGAQTAIEASSTGSYGMSVSSTAGNAIYATSSAGGGYAAGSFDTSTPNTYGVWAHSSGYDGLHTSSDGPSYAALRAVGSSGAYAGIFQGDVGIGTSSPSERLDVSGTVRMTGIKMPTGAVSGYVLTSNGTGTGSWQPVGGGGGGGWTDDGSVVRLETISDLVGIGTTSPGAKLDVKESGSGRAGYFEISNPASFDDALFVENTGDGHGVNSLVYGAGAGFRGYSVGSGVGVIGYNAGTGGAASFWVGTTGNSSDALFANTIGTGRAGNFILNNSGSSSDALYATTNGGGSAVAGENTGSGPGISASSTAGNGIYATSSAGGGYSAGNFYTSTPNTYGLRAESSQYDGLYASTNNSSSAAIRAVNNAGGSAALFEGKVGIGTTSPLQLLHIYDDIAPFIGFDHNGSYGWAIGSNRSGGELQFSRTDPTGGWTIMRIETDGEVSTSPSVRMNLGGRVHEPNSILTVKTGSRHSGYFSSDSLNTNTEVIHSEFTGTGGYDATAVYGKSRPQDYWGYGGKFEGGYIGVEGGVNPTGSNAYFGVFGHATGGSGTNYGVYGSAAGSGSNFAGYFSGDVSVTGNLSKGGGSFKIDHPLDPENKYLYHSFVESPDMKNIYDGVNVLDDQGEAWVQLPDWFGPLNRDFRYQLTAIGEPGPNLYIAEKISGNRFKIAGGEPGMEVSWQVTGIRQDRYAEANRIPVEEDKPARYRGKYLHPDAYNVPETMGIDYHDLKEKR